VDCISGTDKFKGEIIDQVKLVDKKEGREIRGGKELACTSHLGGLDVKMIC